MNCNLEKCQWFAFNQCCGDNEEMYESIVPNRTNCPHYKDIHTEAEKARLEVISEIKNMMNVLNIEYKPEYDEHFMICDVSYLFKCVEDLCETYQLHKQNENLEQVLKDVEDKGIEWVREKYNLSC
ncbi:hypothetical protein ACU3L3_07460 [Priestia endophytica]